MSIYRDLNLTFQSHPNSHDCLKRQDIDAVKASLKTLIFSGPYDSPFDPAYGANIRGMLFELSSPALFALAKRQLMLTISQYEPRAIIEDIYVADHADENRINLGILFYVVGNPDKQTLTYTISRTS